MFTIHAQPSEAFIFDEDRLPVYEPVDNDDLVGFSLVENYRLGLLRWVIVDVSTNVVYAEADNPVDLIPWLTAGAKQLKEIGDELDADCRDEYEAERNAPTGCV